MKDYELSNAPSVPSMDYDAAADPYAYTHPHLFFSSGFESLSAMVVNNPQPPAPAPQPATPLMGGGWSYVHSYPADFYGAGYPEEGFHALLSSPIQADVPDLESSADMLEPPVLVDDRHQAVSDEPAEAPLAGAAPRAPAPLLLRSMGSELTDDGEEGEAGDGKVDDASGDPDLQRLAPGETPDGRPSLSYATMITSAIESSPQKRMTVSEIYEWILTHYKYFRTAKCTWKNSVRHNLTTKRIFVRDARPTTESGKGGYWTINEAARDTPRPPPRPRLLCLLRRLPPSPQSERRRVPPLLSPPSPLLDLILLPLLSPPERLGVSFCRSIPAPVCIWHPCTSPTAASTGSVQDPITIPDFCFLIPFLTVFAIEKKTNPLPICNPLFSHASLSFFRIFFFSNFIRRNVP
ncbi:uncharacterized protein VTP21DRAFT_454 [Calcarisporiella thermophila]|uniref:uncharacterized protein n=1 Tax=Calcarisporiella thermophila TaxID=911321 RepID=UPI003742DEBB